MKAYEEDRQQARQMYEHYSSCFGIALVKETTDNDLSQ